MRRVLPVLSIWVLSGCATPGQDPVELPFAAPAEWSAEPLLAGDTPIAESLLDLLQDDRLDDLVSEALTANADLRATAKRLEAQGYLLGLTRARMRPRADLDIAADRSELGAERLDSFRAGFAARWELDLWGRLADEHEASARSWLAAEQDWLAARDVLATRVIQAWVHQVSIRRAISLDRTRVGVLQSIEDLLVQRYRNGTGSLDELSGARARRFIAEADLSVREAALGESSRGVEVLLGRVPRARVDTGTSLPIILRPAVGVPADQLLARPDIRSAIRRVESANASLSAARKERLPNITISANLFREAATLAGLARSTNRWTILGSLLQPLYEGGRIESTVHARASAADAALLELYGDVLRAIKEVEDALDLDRELRAQVDSLGRASEASEASTRFYEQRYRQGLESLQSLLIAQEQEMAVKLRLVIVQGQQLTNTVDLALALGVPVTTVSAAGP